MKSAYYMNCIQRGTFTVNNKIELTVNNNVPQKLLTFISPGFQCPFNYRRNAVLNMCSMLTVKPFTD